MTTENKTLPTRSRLANIFRRRKEEISKEVIKREVFLDHYADTLMAGADIFYRIPLLQFGVCSVAKKIERDGRAKSPILGILGVGGLARRNIGHTEEYIQLSSNISNATENVLRDKLHAATLGYDDFDGFLILDNMSENDETVFADSLRGVLPLPASIRGFFSFEFHEDCIKIKKEFQSLVESSRNNHYVPMLKQHEREILDPDPNKEVQPVVLYMKPESGFQPTLQELIDKGRIRTMESYNNMTFLPWGRRYKETFPKRANEILGDVVSEVTSNYLDLEQDDATACLEVYSKL